jgi:hypothetical protein
MTRRAATMVVLVLLLRSPAAEAHEQSLHEGKPVEGEVAALGADRLTLKTAMATLTVVLDEKTRFQRDHTPAAKADLAQGDHLTIFGTKLATGELVAREVLIAGAHDAGTPGHSGHETHGGHER